MSEREKLTSLFLAEHGKLEEAYYTGLSYREYAFKNPKFACPKCAGIWDRGYKETTKTQCDICKVTGIPQVDMASKDAFDLIHGYLHNLMFIYAASKGVNPMDWKSLTESAFIADPETGKTPLQIVQENTTAQEPQVEAIIGNAGLVKLKKDLGV